MATRYPSIPGVTFKDIPDFPGYCVGDDGSVWSCKGHHGAITEKWRQLTIFSVKGYPQVTLTKGGKPYMFKVYRLVLLAFVGPCPEGMEACHDPDPNPMNCRLVNLRWDTRKANSHDRVKHGTAPVGERHGMAKLTERDVREIRRLGKSGVKQYRLAERYGVNRSVIGLIARGKLWKCVPQ